MTGNDDDVCTFSTGTYGIPAPRQSVKSVKRKT